MIMIAKLTMIKFYILDMFFIVDIIRSIRWLLKIGIGLSTFSLFSLGSANLIAYAWAEMPTHEDRCNTPARCLEQARLLVDQDKLSQALEILAPFCMSGPQHPVLYSDYLVILFWNGAPRQAVALFEMLPSDFPKRPYLLRNMAKAYFDMHNFSRATELYQKTIDADPADPLPRKGFVLSLIKSGQMNEARVKIDAWFADVPSQRHALSAQLAWAFFQARDISGADRIYKEILAQAPSNKAAAVGRIYCLARQKLCKEALALASVLSHRYSDDPEVLFARAYACEQAGRFLDALAIYDRILALFPNDRTAGKLRIIAMSDMELSSQALELAGRDFAHDRIMHNRILADMAVDAIRWQEPETALGYLNGLPDQNRAYDRIVALVDAQKHSEALLAYKKLDRDRHATPYWVLEKAGQACLHLDQPHKALQAYESALALQPHSWSGRLGKFYALQDLRAWPEAEALLQQLEEEIDLAAQRYPSAQNYEKKLDLAIVRGWFLIHQNQLRDAGQYFRRLRDRVPANIEIRSAQAHIYLWRGWPHLAKKEFDIIATMDPEYLPAQPGRLAAVNALQDKASAREELLGLRSQYPHSKHLARLNQEFQVEQMRELVTRLDLSRDEDGTSDIQFESRLSVPLNLSTRLAAFVLWRRSQVDDPDEEQRALGDDKATYFHRAGVGIGHRFNAGWRIRQAFSVDYDDGQEFGSLTRLIATPDDHWRVSLAYDSFSTDMAKRARAAGITAKKTQATLCFQESEWRRYSAGYDFQAYSDGNDREEVQLGYEQNLQVKGDWRTRLYLDLYLMRNSRGGDANIDYFNPRKAWSPSITHKTEHIIEQHKDRSFIQRLLLTAGFYKQEGFDGGLVGGVRYEQQLSLSDRHGLAWGLDLKRQLYDGEAVDGATVDVTYKWRF